MTDTARLIVFSDDWGRHPSSSQHLVRRLLDRHSTLWVNTIGTRAPKLAMEDVGKIARRLTQWIMPKQAASLPANLQVVAPRMYPGFRAAWQRRFNTAQVTNAVHRALGPRMEGERRIAVTTLPTTADLVGKLDVDRWVYYCVDDFSVWPGLDGGVMREMEQQLVRRVDAAIAVSQHLADHLQRLGRPASLLTHGIDLNCWSIQATEPAKSEHLPPSGTDNTLPHWWPRDGGPILLFWGLIDARLDTEWCRAMVDLGTLILVGPAQSPDPMLHMLPKLLLPGAAAYEQLPRLASAADVLVMPYQDLPVTRAMQPLKFKEYLATGKPVVARRLPSIEPWADAADLVDSAEAMVNAIRRRLQDGLPPTQVQARQRLAQESWDGKAEQFRVVLLGVKDQKFDHQAGEPRS